jgi:hypothetical protein
MADQNEGEKSVLAPTEDYYPTQVVGACSKCHAVGVLEFPIEFDFKNMDRVMDRKPIEVDCEHCHEKAEFIPVPNIGLNCPGLHTLFNIEKKRLMDLGLIPKEG